MPVTQPVLQLNLKETRKDDEANNNHTYSVVNMLYNIYLDFFMFRMYCTVYDALPITKFNYNNQSRVI